MTAQERADKCLAVPMRDGFVDLAVTRKITVPVDLRERIANEIAFAVAAERVDIRKHLCQDCLKALERRDHDAGRTILGEGSQE